MIWYRSFVGKEPYSRYRKFDSHAVVLVFLNFGGHFQKVKVQPDILTLFFLLDEYS